MDAKKTKSLAPYLVIFGLAVFAISGVVFAATSVVKNITVNGDYIEAPDAIPAPVEDEFIVGGGVETDDKLFLGNVNIDGDLTSKKIVSTIEVDLDFSKSTTTAVGSTTLLLGTYRHTGDDLICSGSGNGTMINMDGLIPYKSSYKVSTSTCLTANSATCGNGTYSFNNTSTYAILSGAIATSTAQLDPLNADDDEGDFTREAFEINANDWIVIASDFSESGFSTSTMPLTASEGLTASGKAYLNCVKK